MIKPAHKIFAALLVFGIAVSGCAGPDSVSNAPEGLSTAKLGDEKFFARFPDIPMTIKSSIDLDNTLVFGSGEKWLGRLAVTSSHSANEIFDFYKQQTPVYGWREITSIRSNASVLTYVREDRVATIQVENNILIGSSTTITVSPRDQEKLPGVAQALPGQAQASQGMNVFQPVR